MNWSRSRGSFPSVNQPRADDIRRALENKAEVQLVLLTSGKYVKELSKDGRKPFSEIDKIYNFSQGASHYTFEKLKDDGKIWESTVLMRDVNSRYNGLSLLEILDSNLFRKNRKELLELIISEYKGPINRFSLTGDFGIPHGVMLISPIFEEGDFEKETEPLLSKIRGVKIEKLIITNILIGELSYRKLDETYSTQYEILFRDYYKKI